MQSPALAAAVDLLAQDSGSPASSPEAECLPTVEHQRVTHAER